MLLSLNKPTKCHLVEIGNAQANFSSLHYYFWWITYLLADPCESQSHEGNLTSKLKYRRFSSFFSVPFSYFLFIFYLRRFTLPDFPSVSSLASLPFSPCCHRTTATTSLRIFLSLLTLCSYFSLFLLYYFIPKDNKYFFSNIYWIFCILYWNIKKIILAMNTQLILYLWMNKINVR